eukprot:15462-Eustigmatos_ZCMA.PRE.1
MTDISLYAVSCRAERASSDGSRGAAAQPGDCGKASQDCHDHHRGHLTFDLRVLTEGGWCCYTDELDIVHS